MPGAVIECVPNISEGRDPAKVAAIAGAVRATEGVQLLDVSSDPDHNRSVLTFAGPPGSVAEAALACVSKAVELIDLNTHTGVHPRIGAADVVPFIPLLGVSISECVELAHRTGRQIWRRLGVPVYYYGAAALRPERENLAAVRRGQFERLRQEVHSDPARAPDFGGPALHPTAGATAVGARGFLIAYNVNLATQRLEVAQEIARAVRESSGGFRFVKAIGVPLSSRGLVQVSMNLTNFAEIPVERLYDRIAELAAQAGVRVAGCELVGMVPRAAFERAPQFYLRAENFHARLVIENRLVE